MNEKNEIQGDLRDEYEAIQAAEELTMEEALEQKAEEVRKETGMDDATYQMLTLEDLEGLWEDLTGDKNTPPF